MLQKAILLAKKYPEKKNIALISYQELANLYHTLGDYQKSIEFAEAGEREAIKQNNISSLVNNRFEKIQSLLSFKKVDEAFQVLHNTITIAEKITDTDTKGFLLSQTANVYASQGNYIKAIEVYKKSFTAYDYKSKNSIDSRQNLAVTLNNIGNIYSENLRDYKNALFYFQEASKYAEERFAKSRILGNIAETYGKISQYKLSIETYQEALFIAPINFTTSKVWQNPPAKSIQNAAGKSYLLTLIQDKADTWLDYYKATNTKSHLTNALKTYALADSMIDFMRYEHVGEGSKLFWRQKTRGMYERAIEASYLAGDAEAAFRFFEKSKAVLLSDKLNELGANQQLTESSAKRQRALRDSIANLQNQLASLPANDAKRSGIQRRLEQFNDDFEAFRKQLESTNPAYYRYKYDNSTPTIAEFQKSISTNGSGARTVGFVSYFVGDSAIYAFCLDQKARLVRLSLHPSDYQSLANEFLSLCADRSRLNAHYPQYRALAHRLYQLLWKPLGMTASRVIISQDGVFLPFETLLVQPNQNDFLLKHHAISYTYSANFLAKNQTDLAPSLRQGDKLFHRSFVGFAPETFQPSLRQASLKGSVAALEAVEEKFWWGKTLRNNEATKAQFMRYAPNSRVIQLFTHADADSTEAVEPRIYFHDAALRLSELTQADRFAAQLLVLSACKTGVGQNQRGEGVFSLARGFAALGIPSTITTLWSVEDQPTYELTNLFYNYLDQGLPKDEALQRAKLDWLNQGNAADALPSQWAGMILVGDTAPLAMDGLRFIILGLGLLGLGVLGGVWWWRRKK
ncbi:CHAT domain-containing protein/tetratricopeptide (TPR) repeat protein [Runella defluvii]|uniref:CHAT domain-containing protein/tetratricopeptide (TPR) repeat protein n=1 Tax=Runella defluvii TaxID=370973 RepID=A0A7W6ERB1_9BACT|nr:CHAT domain-containing protein [Runella defluvii]MBB3839312.1 CHAT domain-containing protein/tetratricopeptide (TPR) repeat protein [Runella defluvii]